MVFWDYNYTLIKLDHCFREFGGSPKIIEIHEYTHGHGAAWIRTGFCQSLGLAESRLLLVLQVRKDLLAPIVSYLVPGAYIVNITQNSEYNIATGSMGIVDK